MAPSARFLDFFVVVFRCSPVRPQPRFISIYLALTRDNERRVRKTEKREKIKEVLKK